MLAKERRRTGEETDRAWLGGFRRHRSGSAIAEGQATLLEGITEYLDRVRPHTMQLQDVGPLDPGKLLQAGVASTDQRPSRRGAQLGQVGCLGPDRGLLASTQAVGHDRDR